MIKLKESDYESILAYAKKNLPEEACGLLGGRKQGEDFEITDVYLLTNLDHSNEHFTMDPKEQLQAIKDMRAKNISLLGNWHSHPESPSRPSKEDIRLSFDPKMHYMILSLMQIDAPVFNSFHVEKEVVTKEELLIVKGQ